MYGFEKQGISSYSLSIMKSEYPGTLLACFLCESMGCFGEKQMERQCRNLYWGTAGFPMHAGKALLFRRLSECSNA